MSIIISEIIENSIQKDGRRHVREKHTDHLGRDHFVSYVATAELNENLEMNNRVSNLNNQLKSDEKDRVLKHVLTGNSIQTFSFVDITLRQGARYVFRQIHDLEDPRPAKSYAQQVVSAGASTVATILGITNGAATKLVAWAQGVIDYLNDADTAKLNADDAAIEIGGE